MKGKQIKTQKRIGWERLEVLKTRKFQWRFGRERERESRKSVERRLKSCVKYLGCYHTRLMIQMRIF